MSKNILIQEGGIAKQLTVDKLKTNLVGSGTCLWVPEDEVQLTTKTITKNGTYKASDDGYHGYSQVTVSGIGIAQGHDGDGDDAIAEPGPDGELEIKKVPSAIEITTVPTKTSYNDGESIDFTGIVVKAKLKTGGIYSDSKYSGGVIPFNELTFPVQQASYAEIKDSSAESTLPITQVSMPIVFGSSVEIQGPPYADGGYIKYRKRTYSGVDAIAAFHNSSYSWCVVSASKNSGQSVTEYSQYFQDGEEYYNATYTYELYKSYTYAGKTVYYANTNSTGSQHSTGEGTQISPDGGLIDNYSNFTDAGMVAWTIVYGDISSGGQDIPVQWISPFTGDTFTDTFKITVAKSFGSATGGGGSTSGGGAGRND